MTFEFPQQMLKNSQLSNFMKIVQWEPNSSMRRGRQTDMAKLTVALRKSANAPSNISVSANLINFTQLTIQQVMTKKDRNEISLQGY